MATRNSVPGILRAIGILLLLLLVLVLLSCHSLLLLLLLCCLFPPAWWQFGNARACFALLAGRDPGPGPDPKYRPCTPQVDTVSPAAPPPAGLLICRQLAVTRSSPRGRGE